MSKYDYARKLAYREVPETCPKVDSALEAAAEEIKQQTTALRDALISAIERAEDAEDRVTALENRISDLERELAEALAEVSA